MKESEMVPKSNPVYHLLCHSYCVDSFQLWFKIYTQICNLPFLCGVITTLKILGSEALPDFYYLLFSSAIFHLFMLYSW